MKLYSWWFLFFTFWFIFLFVLLAFLVGGL